MSNLPWDFPDPSLSEAPEIKDYSMADTCYDHIVEQVKHFQEKLDSDHEVGVMLTSFGQSLVMYVRSIGFQNPNLIYFYGQVNGSDAQLIQHMSQLNFLLLALKKLDPERPPRRIGF